MFHPAIRPFLLVLLVLLVLGSGSGLLPRGHADEGEAAIGYRTSREVADALRALAEQAREQGLPAEVLAYGRSAGDRPLEALRVGRAVPTVFVHGGLGRRDAAATVACLDLTRRVLEDESATRHLSWLIVPAPNPDALDDFLAGAWPTGGGATDRDRDERRGEDGPADVDGDGEILSMRRASPRGTWVPLAEDDRLLEEQGEDVRRLLSFERLREGLDDDGDGDVNEDPPGLDLTRQLAGWWDEKDPAPWRGDGPFAGYAPEARALMELTHAETGLVAWYGFAGTGAWLLRASEQGNVAEADLPLYERLSPALEERDRTDRKVRKASDLLRSEENPGSDLDWACVHLCIPAFRIPVWWIPKEEGDDRKRDVADERDWLRWNDRALGGSGFRVWKPFAHPTLGAVEIGGWKRFTRYEPPADLLAEVVTAVSEGPLAQIGIHAVLRPAVEVRDRGNGLFELEVRVRNEGDGPTDTRVAEKHRRAAPVRVTFEPAAGATRLVGARERTVGRVGAGRASDPITWLVRREGDGPLGVIVVQHPKADEYREEVRAR